MPVSLVTGGAGFMGSHVAEHLLNMGHEVVVLDDLSGGFVENVCREADFVQGSILDQELIDDLFDRLQSAPQQNRGGKHRSHRGDVLNNEIRAKPQSWKVCSQRAWDQRYG